MKAKFLVAGFLFSSLAFADGAVICKSPHSKGACEKAKYCCYTGSTSEGENFCRNLGCDPGGTSSSCPSEGNRLTCGADPKGATAK